MNRDKISVITVVYNNKQGLEATIKSVSYQTYPNIEFIIIDGNSNDGTLSAIQNNQERIDYWISEPDNGIYDAMNKGIEASTGDWLLFLNSGDVFHKDTIVEEMVKELDDSSIVYGNMIRTDGKHNYLSRGVHGSHLDAYDFMHGSLCHQAAFIKKDLFKRCGNYSLKYKLAADSEFFFRSIVLFHESHKYVDKVVSIFQLGGASTVHHDDYMEERKQFLINYLGSDTYARYEELYWLKHCKTAVFVAKIKMKLRYIKKIWLMKIQ